MIRCVLLFLVLLVASCSKRWAVPSIGEMDISKASSSLVCPESGILMGISLAEVSGSDLGKVVAIRAKEAATVFILSNGERRKVAEVRMNHLEECNWVKPRKAITLVTGLDFKLNPGCSLVVEFEKSAQSKGASSVDMIIFIVDPPNNIVAGRPNGK